MQDPEEAMMNNRAFTTSHRATRKFILASALRGKCIKRTMRFSGPPQVLRHVSKFCDATGGQTRIPLRLKRVSVHSAIEAHAKISRASAR